jgi:hypothetical protein
MSECSDEQTFLSYAVRLTVFGESLSPSIILLLEASAD